MKKLLLILSMLCGIAYGQSGVDSTYLLPANNRTPMPAKWYDDAQYHSIQKTMSVRGKGFFYDSVFHKGRVYTNVIPATTDSSTQMPNTAWVKRLVASAAIAGLYVKDIYKNATADSFIVVYGNDSTAARKDSIGANAFQRDTIDFGPQFKVTAINANRVDVRIDTARAPGKVTSKYYVDSLVAASGGGGPYTLNQTTATDSVSTHAILIDTVNVTRTNAYFFGNSITLGYLLPSTRFRWSTLLSEYYGYTENNFGLSGSYLEKRTPVDPTGAANMVDRIPLIPAYSTGSLLVFMYGINDINFVSANYNTTNFVSDYTTVLDTAIARGWSGSDILLITPTYVSPTSYQSVLGNPAATKTRQMSFDSCVQVLSTTYSTKYFDSYTWMEQNGGKSLFNQSDSLHPNIDGHNVIFNGIVNAIGFNIIPDGQRFSVNGLSSFNNIKLNTTKTIHTKYNLLASDSIGNVSKVLDHIITLDSLNKLTLGEDTPGSYQYNFLGGVTYAGNSLIVNTNNFSALTQPNKYLQLLHVTGKGYIDSYTSSSVAAPLLLNSIGGGNVGIGTNAPAAALSINGGTTSTNIGGFYGSGYNGINLAGSITGTEVNFLSSAADPTLYINTKASNDIRFLVGMSVKAILKSSGNFGIGNTSPTALLHLAAGTAIANTAPLKLTSGTNLTTPEDGAIEYNGTHFYGTVGSTRYQLDQQAAAAGTLTGTTLASNVVTSSLTAIGTLATGAVPASLVTAGTFGTGAYTMGTSLTTPILQGGTGTTSTITIQPTNSASATTGANIIFKVGTSAGTTAGTVSNTGAWDFGSNTLTTLGNITGNSGLFAGNVRASTTGQIFFNSSSTIKASTNGFFEFTNAALTANSSTMVFGGMRTNYVAKTANYTATVSDYTIECTANTFQVTLPTAVGAAGQIYNISNSGAGIITIGTTSSQTFVNVVGTPTTLTLATVGNVTVQSNGANWLQLK